MTSRSSSAFDLADHLSAKADPSLIADDERHLAHVAHTLEASIADLTDRLAAARKAPGGTGQAAMDRDQEIHRLTSRLGLMRRYGLDLCLGRMVLAETEAEAQADDGARVVYVGRLGLVDATGRRLLVDWRSPAAEPFFGATHGDPMGLVSRRRYRWTDGRITDYWDEVYTADGLAARAALDDQSAFIASLDTARSPQMRDVLGTIQADQDAVIRAGSHGALVVDGGPGTGKTVVALHRAAYLLYRDPHVGHRRGGVLFVGPHRPYLSYVADVLPSLGEEGVQTCTLADLVPGGTAAGPETDQQVARLKSRAGMVAAIEPAVDLYEQPPTGPMLVETPWADIRLDAADWAEAFGAAEPGTPHNEARDQVWEALVGILVDKLHEAVGAGPGDADGWDDTHSWDDTDGWDDGASDEFDAYGRTVEDPDTAWRAALATNRHLARAFARAWPLLEPTDVVGDLWTVPAYLRRCAPWLAPEEVSALQRAQPDAWTTSDLPILDAARRRLGDPEASRRRRRHEAALAAERARMSDVVDHLVATDDSDLGVMSMLRGQDLQAVLVDGSALPTPDPDLLAGPFAHVVVDEAQELTDAQWQMLVARCPSRSFTIVGDRAQARRGFGESWRERLERVGLDRIELATLTINYRTPREIMAEAAPVVRSAIPDANVPTSVRSSGIPVRHGARADLDAVLDAWFAERSEGTACVIGDPGFADRPRVRSLSPELAKGLEFDLVVLVEPERFGDGVPGAVDRYVAMTRATQELVVLTA